MPLSRVWTGTKVLAEDLAGEDLADVLDLHAGAMAWWVLDRSSAYGQEELRRLAKALDLDDLAVTDLTAEDQRTKFEQLGQARRGDQRDRSERRVRPAAPATDLPPRHESGSHRAGRPRAGHQPGPAAGHARRPPGRARYRGGGAGDPGGCRGRGYGTPSERLEAAADEISSHLFEERPLTKVEQLSAFRLRSRLSELRRLTEPMRSITADLRLSSEDGDSAVGRQWRMIEEEHGRAANAAERLRRGTRARCRAGLADGAAERDDEKLSDGGHHRRRRPGRQELRRDQRRLPPAAPISASGRRTPSMIIVTVVLFVMFRRGRGGPGSGGSQAAER